MNNKISNPFLKQLISEIAVNANKGRLDLNWQVIEEAKKKKKVKEADEKKTENPATDAGGDLPPLKGADETPKDAPTKEPAPKAEEPKKDAAPETGAADATPKDSDASQEDSNKAKADAAKAKAELAKAQAEKNQAEKEIKKQSYVTLGSSSGTQFLLGKVLDHAFKTNTIDALAGEMVEKLKITTPEDINNFSSDVVTYMAIPGMPELLSSMKTLATKEPETTEEPTA